MSKEFYNYIAKSILSYFQARTPALCPGERYCLKLDTEEMVKGVDKALRDIIDLNGILGKFNYENVYSTYTIRLAENMEMVVASKINGMTDDFLATLRNAEMTSKHFPILIVTHSTIDTITSGTGDLAAKGMPFHAVSIIDKIKDDIKNMQLSVSDRTLLEMELNRKQEDRFSDNSSLFEYSDLLTVLGHGYVQERDYPKFSLLPDPSGTYLTDATKIRERLEDNRRLFETIDRAIKHGNIGDDLEAEFDSVFIAQLEDCKKKDIPWYTDCTYDSVKRSQDKLKNRLSNPLQISNTDIEAYSGSLVEYRFVPDEQFFICDDGNTKAKSRKKNILIYNPDQCGQITIVIKTNIAIRSNYLETQGCTASSALKQVRIDILPKGCTFAQTKITDQNNNITYEIKICVIDVVPRYLENIQTSYRIHTPKYLKKSVIRIFGVDKGLIINPGASESIEAVALNGESYECHHNQTLNLRFGEDSIDSDTGHMDCVLKCGSITIPIQIEDEVVKKTELTGIGAFKWKFSEGKSLEYRNGKIVSGTTEFFTKEAFRAILEKEEQLVKNEWLAIWEKSGKMEEYELTVPDEIRFAYIKLVRAFKDKRTLPSLAYYEGTILEAAKNYVKAVETKFEMVEAGSTLSKKENDTLLLGCVIKDYDEHAVEMSPLHPLNVLYQIKLLEEEAVGSIRDHLVEKLTALYLIPFFKNSNKELYRAIEQKFAPEWRSYAPVSNKRYQGARNFVQKLVCEKIIQYREHFSFLFDDIGNNRFLINLVNMGDCREIFQGLMHLYVQSLRGGADPDNLLNFDINIYAEREMYNEFLLLSDQHKLKAYIKALFPKENISELALIMSGKIRCFFRSPSEKAYQYAHLTFYEMNTKKDTGASRMDSIPTGISMHGLISGTPSVLNAEWYKTGFGMKYAEQNQLTRLAAYYNAMHRVAFSGSSYEPNSSIFTEIEQGQEEQLNRIYASSNWVVFVEPKVDLSFFQKKNSHEDELMIIHYSDQHSSASGYDDITVTQKSEQYNEIICEQLRKKGVAVSAENVKGIISLFNAVNGGWMLRLITTRKLTGAVDSYFSREKMSILSAIKLCMAYYSHPDIVWIPVSLEEMLRVSGGAGLSQKDGILSAKNLGFEQRATSDDILLAGIEGPVDQIKIYIHPVEVKIGQNQPIVINKAKEQVLNTYKGLWDALWPEEGRNHLERKLSRNFFIQLLLVCCEKLKLYNIYPDESWDDVLEVYRENLLNEKYEFSKAMDPYMGKGTIVSFGTDVLNKHGILEDDICLLEFPEKLGSSYMVLSASRIEQELEWDSDVLPKRIIELYVHQTRDTSNTIVEKNINTEPPAESETELCRSEPIESGICESLSEIQNDETEVENVLDPDITVSKEAQVVSKNMEILLGTDVTTGNPVFWYPNDTSQLFHTNTGIIGTMGTGKTQFTKSLVTQLFRNQCNNIGNEPLGILIFDYKGDYNESKEDFVKATNARVLKPYHLPFNPLALTRSRVFKPLLPIHTANAFKDTLSKVYGLGPKQQNTLFQCIIDAYARKGIIAGDSVTWDKIPPTFDTVYSIYSSDDKIKKNDSLAAAMDKLSQFQVFEGNPEKTQSLFELLNGVVVIDLSGFDTDIQSLIVAITLDLFYSQMQAAGSSRLEGQYRQLTRMILVDEADNFMSEGFSSLKKILKEGREFGVGTILSTQFLKHFGNGDDDYSKYILTWVVHNVADLRNSDVEFVFKTEAKSFESTVLYNDIKALQKHYSIIKISNQRPRYVRDKAFWELVQGLE